MTDYNPFRLVGSLRSHTTSSSNTMPKRDKADREKALKTRHDIEDYRLAKECGISLEELRS
ncbi:hypothetical protein [Alteromonas sp. RKMC-009]|uniref:hypothetical protein n=1 Tax=Alteromonas sp. RKMC-009 TaxID=2267264 RepID=UPI000E679B64|nr:hypothetical protein [Alteromonas sp. RKMC-009]AYA63852.1 hypothetical protein DS731_07460 [Alteromonas sp. RKMC-009]